MNKIHPTEKTFPAIRDCSAHLPRIDAAQVQEALGADVLFEELSHALSPITLFALRQELIKRMQSSGSRSGQSELPRQDNVRISDKEWLRLEELAALIATPGFAPSAGQVASILLSLSLHLVASQVASAPSSSPIAKELKGLISFGPRKSS